MRLRTCFLAGLAVLLLTDPLYPPGGLAGATHNSGKAVFQGRTGAFVHGREISNSYSNSGQAIAIGGSGNGYGRGGYGLVIWSGGLDNSGNFRALGGNGGNAAQSHGGYGTLLLSGNLHNQGRLSAQGGNGGSGAAAFGGTGVMLINGDMSSSGVINSAGGLGGSGLGAEGGDGLGLQLGDFHNRGRDSFHGGKAGAGLGARGGNGATLNAGNMENYGILQGYGGAAGNSAVGGDGLRISAGSVLNAGSLIFAGGAGGASQLSTGGYGAFVQAGLTNYGNILTVGGNSVSDGDGGYGLYVFSGQLLNHGQILAKGGLRGDISSRGCGGSGLEIGGSLINSGYVAAVGGSAGAVPEKGAGLTLWNGLDNRGGLALLPGDGAPAVRVQAGPSIFQNGSQLQLGGGSFSTYARSVAISPGAGLVSLAASALPEGGTLVQTGFIETNGGLISGSEFSYPSGPVLEYSTVPGSGPGYSRYSLAARRRLYASSFLEGNPALVLQGLEQGLQGKAVTLDNLPWFRLLAELDNSPTEAAIRRSAANLPQDLTAHGTSRAVVSLARLSRLPGSKASQMARAGFGAVNPEEPEQTWLFWVEPFYYSGKQQYANFADLREQGAGLSLGLALRGEPLSIYAAGHVMSLDLDSHGFDSQAEGWGLTAGAHSLLPLLENVDLHLEAQFGYSLYELRQRRRDLAGAWAHSSPDVETINASFSSRLDFQAGGLIFSPLFKVEYARLDLDSYTEHGGVYNLSTESRLYHSTLGSMGLALAWELPASLTWSAQALYTHEFSDTRLSLPARAAAAPEIRLEPEMDRVERSGYLFGSSLRWQSPAGATFGLSYDYRLADDYHGHMLSAGIKIPF